MLPPVPANFLAGRTVPLGLSASCTGFRGLLCHTWHQGEGQSMGLIGPYCVVCQVAWSCSVLRILHSVKDVYSACHNEFIHNAWTCWKNTSGVPTEVLPGPSSLCSICDWTQVVSHNWYLLSLRRHGRARDSLHSIKASGQTGFGLVPGTSLYPSVCCWEAMSMDRQGKTSCK